MTERKPVTAEELGALYRNHRTSLTATARQALRARGLPESVVSAEDIVQTAFTRALRDPAAIEHPVGYLRVVIRNEVANQVRQCAEHRRMETLRTADPLRFDPARCPDFTTLVGNRWAVEQALAGLTLPQRTAVWTTKALDHTLDEAATLMDRAPGTVATHVSRGMVLLRAALAAAVVAAIGFAATGSGLGGRLRRTDPAGQPAEGPGASPGRWWRQGWAVLVALYERSPGVAVLAALVLLAGCAYLWRACRPVLGGRPGGSLRTMLDLFRKARFRSRAMSRFVRLFTTRGATSKGGERGSVHSGRKRGRAARPEPSDELPDPRHATPAANTRLQDLFALAGWSRRDLAQLVNREAAVMGRPELSTDISRVRRWIDTGEVPRDPVPRVLADLFTERLGRVVTVEDLGLVRHGRAGGRPGAWSPAEHPGGVPWAAERTAAVLTEFTGMDLMLNRRGLVGIGKPVTYVPDATREALKILEVVTHAPHGAVSRAQIARSLGRFETIDESALSLLIRQGHLRQLPNNKYAVAGRDLSALTSMTGPDVRKSDRTRNPRPMGHTERAGGLRPSVNGVAPR